MILLVDANVLIDFVTTEPEVLSLVVTHLGSVHVPRDVLLEVEQLEESTCGALGLEVVDGTLDQLAEAATGGGRLSYADRVCLILARDHGWTRVTNDGRLRRECETTGIAVLRGCSSSSSWWQRVRWRGAAPSRSPRRSRRRARR